VTDLGAAGASAQEAPAEEEGSDAVRLLTIHSAKGLEFKVVVVADAGRAGPNPSSDEILCLTDGRFGFRVADPGGGRRRPALGYELVREIDAAQEEAERRRLYYVAMTRAIDRLIVSGAIDPGRQADAETPIGWILERLGREVLEQDGDEPREVVCGNSSVLVRIDRFRPAGEEPGEEESEKRGEAAANDQLSLFQQGPAPTDESVLLPPPLETPAEIPAPPPHSPRRLSYSALRQFESCPYRYYAERVCGMKPLPRPPVPIEGAGLAATDLGSAVHELLEGIDLTAPRPPEPEQLVQHVRSRYPAATDGDLERIRRLVSNYCGSELAGRVAGLPRLETELPFVFEQDGVLVNGFLDVASLGDSSAFVLDYKTNLLERDVEEIVEDEYRLQRLVYALACLRAGYEQVEVVYAFLEDPNAVAGTSYRAEDAPGLEKELSEAIERIGRGDFPPRPGPYACADCPANGVVCAGMDLPGAPPRLSLVPAES
jgi:ATP-dependent helicase/nuclease subunit A